MLLHMSLMLTLKLSPMSPVLILMIQSGRGIFWTGIIESHKSTETMQRDDEDDNGHGPTS